MSNVYSPYATSQTDVNDYTENTERQVHEYQVHAPHDASSTSPVIVEYPPSTSELANQKVSQSASSNNSNLIFSLFWVMCFVLWLASLSVTLFAWYQGQLCSDKIIQFMHQYKNMYEDDDGKLDQIIKQALNEAR